MGRAYVERFVDEGAQVVIADLDEEVADEVANSISEKGGRVRSIGVDVGNHESITSMVDVTLEWAGAIDVLVNNAGIVIADGNSIDGITQAEWSRLMSVNVGGMFFAIQAVAPHMKERGRGKIINIASTSGYISSTQPAVVYDTSKGAVRQLTVSAAYELAPYGIYVNAIAPGTIKTDLSTSLADPEQLALLEKLIPLGRLGQPAEVTGAAVFLASSDSDYVVGHTLVVDGGRLTV